MKNWKKLLACLLVGLMALTVFTACDASVGAPMGPKRSDAESAKALCDKFKMTYNVEMTYNEDLSEKAYSIANWIAGTSVSCSTNANMRMTVHSFEPQGCCLRVCTTSPKRISTFKSMRFSSNTIFGFACAICLRLFDSGVRSFHLA